MVLAGALLLAGAAAAREPIRSEGDAVPGELIVGLRAGVSDAQGNQLLSAAGAQVERKLRRTRARLTQVDPARVDEILERLRRDPRVTYAEPNYRLHTLATPNDPSFGQLWGLANTGQTV